jgi:hypothetical protein
MHVVIDGNVETGRYCERCFEQYLRDRHAANLPITPGWAKQLGLKVTVCANCESGIPEPDCYVGAKAVCGQKCAQELLARMPKEPARVIEYEGPPVQLIMPLVYKRQ